MNMTFTVGFVCCKVTYGRNMVDLQVPDMTNYSMAGRTYRYSNEDPLYPFGYGL